MLQIIPYQAHWVTEFNDISISLQQKLGALALQIDHIGSTSVPGLAAKDIIDVQITVAVLEPQIITALTNLGYIWREDIQQDHCPAHLPFEAEQWIKLYFKNSPQQREIHLHVRIQGRRNQRFALLFRDYLRAHPPIAAAYAELKRRLAEHLPNRAIYAEVKDPAVDLIYWAAEAWAKQLNLHQGAVET